MEGLYANTWDVNLNNVFEIFMNECALVCGIYYNTLKGTKGGKHAIVNCNEQ